MLDAGQLTAIASIIAAIGGIVAAVLTYLQRKPVNATNTNAANTAAAVTMTNGATIAQGVEGIGVAVGSHPNVTPPTPSA